MSKYYDYYITDENKASEMKERYELEISPKRDAIHNDLLNKTGAIAWTEQKNWGKQSSICSLVFNSDHNIKDAPFICKPKHDRYEGKRVIIVRGKSNRKDGIAFNQLVKDANEALSKLPKYTEWLVSEFGVMRTGFGESTGMGTQMTSTYGGNIGNILGFAIPNSENEKHGVIDIPEFFKKITFGEWYDLINN